MGSILRSCSLVVGRVQAGGRVMALLLTCVMRPGTLLLGASVSSSVEWR